MSTIWLIYTLIGLILSCVVILGYKIPRGTWKIYGIGFAIIGVSLSLLKKIYKLDDNNKMVYR